MSPNFLNFCFQNLYSVENIHHAGLWRGLVGQCRKSVSHWVFKEKCGTGLLTLQVISFSEIYLGVMQGGGPYDLIVNWPECCLPWWSLPSQERLVGGPWTLAPRLAQFGPNFSDNENPLGVLVKYCQFLVSSQTHWLKVSKGLGSYVFNKNRRQFLAENFGKNH